MSADDEKALGPLGRQEILTGLIFAVLALIPAGAFALLIVGLSNPDLLQSITVSGEINFGTHCMGHDKRQHQKD